MREINITLSYFIILRTPSNYFNVGKIQIVLPFFVFVFCFSNGLRSPYPYQHIFSFEFEGLVGSIFEPILPDNKNSN